MWGKTTRVDEQPPAAVDGPADELEALDLRILRILEEAGAGQSLSHARRDTDDLAVLLIASGASTFLEFDRSLERLEAQSMIGLDNGVASLSERGHHHIGPPGPAAQGAEARVAPLPAAA